MSVFTELTLADGGRVYFDAAPSEVARLLNKRGLVQLPSGRYVNPQQVTRLERVPEVSSIHTPERLEAEED